VTRVNPAVIADIHGDLPVLKAVLEDAHGAGTDAFVGLGDVANFGLKPQAVLCRVQALGCPVVPGNTDDALRQSAAPTDGASLEGGGAARRTPAGTATVRVDRLGGHMSRVP
jgi:predicted phosphodiesterase